MTDRFWVSGAEGSGFDVDHLPYGVVRLAEAAEARVGVRVGDHVLDLAAAAPAGAP